MLHHRPYLCQRGTLGKQRRHLAEEVAGCKGVETRLLIQVYQHRPPVGITKNSLRKPVVGADIVLLLMHHHHKGMLHRLRGIDVDDMNRPFGEAHTSVLHHKNGLAPLERLDAMSNVHHPHIRYIRIQLPLHYPGKKVVIAPICGQCDNR